MVIIYLIYGVSFFTLGVLAFCSYRYESKSILIENLSWLGWFATIHGIHEWLQMLLYAKVIDNFYIDELTAVSNTTLVLSFIALFYFALCFCGWMINFYRKLIFFTIIFLCYLLNIEIDYQIIMASRWFLCLPASLLIAYSFLHEKNTSTLISKLRLRHHYLIMAISFFSYAILSGLFVAKTSTLPWFIPTQELFHDSIGFPIQLVRALCATIMMVSLFFILRAENNYIYQQALFTNKRLENSVLERTQELTSEIQMRQQLQEELLLFKYFFDFSQEALLITDAEKNILEVNPQFTEITGCQRNEIIGKTPAYLKSGRHDHAFYEDMWRSINDTGRWQGEVFDKRKNGEIYPKWLFIMAVYNQAKEVTHYLGMFSDVSH